MNISMSITYRTMLKSKISCELNINTLKNLKDTTDEMTLFTHFIYFQKAIEVTFNNVTFCWNEEQYFYPIKGDYDTLGYIIPIREYSWMELTNYMIKSTTPIILYFDENLAGHENHFENIKVHQFIDYNSTISYLEKHEFILVKHLDNPFLTDNRSFMFNKNILKNIGIDDEYYDEWWNVDLLGTALSEELSNIITQLYDYCNYVDNLQDC